MNNRIRQLQLSERGAKALALALSFAGNLGVVLTLGPDDLRYLRADELMNELKKLHIYIEIREGPAATVKAGDLLIGFS